MAADLCECVTEVEGERGGVVEVGQGGEGGEVEGVGALGELPLGQGDLQGGALLPHSGWQAQVPGQGELGGATEGG